MKRNLKIFLIVLGVFSLVAISCGIAIPLVIIKNLEDKTNNKTNVNTLTSKTVKQNFASNGIWYNKTSLTADDFKDYDSLEYDCFDNLTNQLEFVEIPDSIKIDFSKKTSSSKQLSTIIFDIDWSSVKNIKVKSTDSEFKNVFACNGILFIHSSIKTYSASTILNRVDQQVINFPNINDLPANVLISISNNFYKENIFKNVSKININSNAIVEIGKDAFYKCSKLSSELLLNLDENKYSSITIWQNAFKNSNIATVNITCSHIISITNEVFSNCNNLTSVTLDSDDVQLFSKSFSQCNDNFSISIMGPILLGIYDNVFSNNYTNFKISIISGYVASSSVPLSYDFDSSAFSGINVNIDNFIMEINDGVSIQLFNNVGLSNEQFNKITIIEWLKFN